eukprot:9190439-Pyramimonas_sp.AAC.1
MKCALQSLSLTTSPPPWPPLIQLNSYRCSGNSSILFCGLCSSRAVLKPQQDKDYVEISGAWLTGGPSG